RRLLFVWHVLPGAPPCFPTRRSSDLVAGEAQRAGLVDRDPVADAVAEGLPGEPGVLGEPRRGVAHGPSAGPLELDRGVPVEERRSEEHTSELQSRDKLVCRLLLEQKK